MWNRLKSRHNKWLQPHNDESETKRKKSNNGQIDETNFLVECISSRWQSRGSQKKKEKRTWIHTHRAMRSNDKLACVHERIFIIIIILTLRMPSTNFVVVAGWVSLGEEEDRKK